MKYQSSKYSYFLSVVTAITLSMLASVGFAQTEEPTDKVDIGQASIAELITLPGIGPTRAKAIIEYRQRRPFRITRQIMRVKGIGRATFLKLKDKISLNSRIESRPQKRGGATSRRTKPNGSK